MCFQRSRANKWPARTRIIANPNTAHVGKRHKEKGTVLKKRTACDGAMRAICSDIDKKYSTHVLRAGQNENLRSHKLKNAPARSSTCRCCVHPSDFELSIELATLNQFILSPDHRSRPRQ